MDRAEIMARRKRADQLRNMPRDELVEWYSECTVEQISHSMRISHKTVSKILAKRGIKKELSKHMTELQRRAIHAVTVLNQPAFRVAKELGIGCYRTVQRWVAKAKAA